MQLVLNVVTRGHSGFVSPFAFLLVSQMQHYTHNPSVAYTLGVGFGFGTKVWLCSNEFIQQVRIMRGGQAAARECAFNLTQSPARKRCLHVQHNIGGMTGRWEGRANHVLSMSCEI